MAVGAHGRLFPCLLSRGHQVTLVCVLIASFGLKLIPDAQVRVKVVDQEKSTAAASGQQDPGWDETLDFAISGEFAQDEDVQIRVEVGSLSVYHASTTHQQVDQ